MYYVSKKRLPAKKSITFTNTTLIYGNNSAILFFRKLYENIYVNYLFRIIIFLTDNTLISVNIK